MVKITILGFLGCTAAFAGQSIALTEAMAWATVPTSIIDPSTTPCRVEHSVSNWDAGATSHLADVGICAIKSVFTTSSGNLVIGIEDDNVNIPTPCQITIGTLANAFVTYRYQHVPQTPTTGYDTCEAWDSAGNYLPISFGTIGSATHILQYTSYSPANYNQVCVFGETGANCSPGSTLGPLWHAYFRIYNTAVSVGSIPPTTAQSLAGCLLQWKFDGNLNDSCGTYTATVTTGSGGSYSYQSTPFQNLVVAIAKSGGIAPQNQAWMQWTTARIGYSNSLDSSNSYSQIDASPTVTSAWTFVSGPSSITLNNPTTAFPTYTPTSFGTYNFNLSVTDAASNTATAPPCLTGVASLCVGAVAYDSNGVVIPSDPNVTKILGPMIAYGQNPWGYADNRAYQGVVGQNAYYQASWGLPNPSWSQNAAGTVAYTFGGIGNNLGATGGTLHSSIVSTTTSILVDNANNLPSLANLPTIITIGNNGSQEAIAICSYSVVSGNEYQLNVCTNATGRGIQMYATGWLAAQSWGSGTNVGELSILGTGTQFVSDPTYGACPAAPGPPGTVQSSFSSGTVTASGSTITGSGTNWTTAIVSNAGGNNTPYWIRATFSTGGGSGTYQYSGLITAVASTTSMTVSPPLPTVDATPVSFQIIGNPRLIVLGFVNSEGAQFRGWQWSSWCMSETNMSFMPARDTTGFGSYSVSAIRQSGQPWTYLDHFGWGGNFNPNFYGSGMASLAFWLRSGWDFARDTHRMMDDKYIIAPEISGGYYNPFSFDVGGAYIGAEASIVLDPHAGSVTWPQTHPFLIANGNNGTQACYQQDTRQGGYFEGQTALAAAYDVGAMQSTWAGYLTNWLTYDNYCNNPVSGSWPAQTQAAAAHSWANAFSLSPGTSALQASNLNVTNGSTAVTGTSIPSSACYGLNVADGSHQITVTKGSSAFTMTGGNAGWGGTNNNANSDGTGGYSININGTNSSVLTPIRLSFVMTSSSAGYLSAQWPYDSGTFSYMAENISSLTTLALTPTGSSPNTTVLDPEGVKQYGCVYNSSSSITLSRPWEGSTTGSGEYVSAGPNLYVGDNLVGVFQQGFMTGIKQRALNWGYLTNSSFNLYLPYLGNWQFSYGWDPVELGMYYGSIFTGCPPPNVTPTSTSTSYAWNATQSGCSYGLAGVEAARVQNAEASAAAIQYVINQRYSASSIAWMDQVYGAMFGNPSLTANGYFTPSDGQYVTNELSDASLGSYKWDGFFFGMGMAHQWPAIRALISAVVAGGVQGRAAANATIH